MTLILAAANPHSVIMVGDRLVTLGTRPFDPDYDKMWVVEWPRARIVAGMTGMAYGYAKGGGLGYGLHAMVAGTLHRAICDRPTVQVALERTRARLERQTALFKWSVQQRGLALLLVGYRVDETDSELFGAVVTNFDDAGRGQAPFRTDSLPVGQSAFVASVGLQGALRQEDLAHLRAAVANDRPSHELESLALNAISRAARSEGGRRYIGREYNAVTLSVERAVAPTASYHSRTAAVAKHPSFITPEVIFLETYVEAGTGRRSRKRNNRRTSAPATGRISTQFSPRDCPPDESSAREDARALRARAYAKALVETYLIEHRASVPDSLRPRSVETFDPGTGGVAQGWAFPDLPEDEPDLWRVLAELAESTKCDHGARVPAVCAEARRALRAKKCTECEAEFNGFMEHCATCDNDVCTNTMCPILVGDPRHAWNPEGGLIHHLH